MSEQEPNGDLPVWVRVLFRYGIVGFLALVFAYVLVNDVRAALASVQRTVDAHDTNERRDGAVMRYYLRQVCLNTATTEPARAGCVLPEEAR